MTTITAKELRDNLGDIVKRVQNGESVKVTYRNRTVLQLSGDTGSTGAKKDVTTNTFIKRVAKRREKQGKPHFDPEKSIKELYHEMLDNDPKYKGIF